MIVNNKEIPENKINTLIQDIKSNKYNIEDSYIKEELRKYFTNNFKIVKIFLESEQFNRTKECKTTIKHVRDILRKRIDVFQTNTKVKKLLDQLKKDLSVDNHNKALKTNKSTRERLEIYPEIYQKIFSITGTPKTILDLACGLNPLSLPYMKLQDVNYTAIDINKEVIDAVKEYFQIMHINGVAKQQDITQTSDFEEADICFLFKALDVLELKKGHKFAEELIKNIPAKYIIPSFSTKTLSGRPMNHPQRGWIERLCQRLNYEYKVIKECNEIFYIIRK